MQLFYAPDIETDPVLPEMESQHCIKVLRLNEGDTLTLTDGKNSFYQAMITEANAKHCRVRIIERLPQARLWPFRLHIAVAPTKNIDRTEWFVEKATEVGIDEITCLNCRFSERREVKPERLKKVLVSAMKQSQKAQLPQLTGMTDFHSFISRPFKGCKMIAHCHQTSLPLIQSVYHPCEDALILIGPEGDFSEKEVALAEEHGFLSVSLGKSRLRTETAAFAACHTIHILNQLRQ